MDGLHREELHALRPLPLSDAAVLLVGHGSHLSPDSSRPIHDLALHIRRLARFAEVRVAFWKEEPNLHYALDLVESTEVFVVPVFMGSGYFTEKVLPRELGLEGSVTRRDGRRIHYCSPVGKHRGLARVIADRAAEIAPEELRRRSTLVILGHGTDRHPGSGDTTDSMVSLLKLQGQFAQVVPAFLDQQPTLDAVLKRDLPGDRIIVPFFVSEGWHVGTTIPEDLARGRATRTESSGRIRYSAPVGTHPAMAEIVVEIVESAAREAGSRAEGETSEAPGATPAARAKRAFREWIRSGDGQPRRFLQTLVSWSESDGFEVRHENDGAVPAGELREIERPEYAREIAAKTAEGSYRPLKTAPDLSSGWRFSRLTEDQVWEVYAYLYPAAPVHWDLQRRGQLRLTDFREAAGRQTGIYARAASLGRERVSELVGSCCSPSRCLREPTWAGYAGASMERPAPEPTPAEAAAQARVPCPAPCSVFLAEAVEVDF